MLVCGAVCAVVVKTTRGQGRYNMQTISYYANQAIDAENEMRYAEAAELWEEAAQRVLSLRIVDQLKGFADRCRDKIEVVSHA